MTEKLADFHDPEHVWIFTFGLGLFSAPARYIKIKGTYDSARKEVCRRFGKKWAFQYPSEEKAGVAQWDLQEITEEQAAMLEKLAAAEERARQAALELARHEREDFE